MSVKHLDRAHKVIHCRLANAGERLLESDKLAALDFGLVQRLRPGDARTVLAVDGP